MKARDRAGVLLSLFSTLAACATGDGLTADAGGVVDTAGGVTVFVVDTDAGTQTGSERGTAATSIQLGGSTTSASSASAWTSATGSDVSTSSAASSSASAASSTSSSTSGTASGSQSGTSAPSSSTSSGGGTCYKAPTALHAETTAGVYCPFSGVDGGAALTCPAGDHCCEPPATSNTTSTCVAASKACPIAASTRWDCDGTLDCAATPGTVCCGTGTIEAQAAQPACGDGGIAPFEYISDFAGSSCAASCSGYQICSKDSECPGGATCSPVEPKGAGIGYCKS